MNGVKHILRLAIAFFLQIFLVNNLQLLGVCQPFIYIVFLLMLPKTMPYAVDLLIGAAVGLAMDLFCDSLGVHMAACIFIMYLRRKMICNLILDHDRLHGEISSHTIGMQAFLKYAILLIIFMHVVVFFLSAWSFAHLGMTLLRIVVSSIVCALLVIGYDLTRK